MKPQGISDSVAFFLLETLYAQLLLNKGIIDAARPALEAYVGKRLIEVDVPALRAFGPAPAATADKPPADAVVEDDVPDYVHKAFAQFDIPEPVPPRCRKPSSKTTSCRQTHPGLTISRLSRLKPKTQAWHHPIPKAPVSTIHCSPAWTSRLP
jgi:hypothetical protein